MKYVIKINDNGYYGGRHEANRDKFHIVGREEACKFVTHADAKRIADICEKNGYKTKIEEYGDDLAQAEYLPYHSLKKDNDVQA